MPSRSPARPGTVGSETQPLLPKAPHVPLPQDTTARPADEADARTRLIDLETAQRRDLYASAAATARAGAGRAAQPRGAPAKGAPRRGAGQFWADASMTSPCSFQFSPSNSMICMASIG